MAGVSGTGQIDREGNVYPAARMLEKARAAKEAGVTQFIMPYDFDQALGLPRGTEYFICGTVAEAWKVVSE